MGLFRKVGKLVDAAFELTDESSHGIGPLADAPPVELGPDATSLDDLRALHESSGGRSGRAVVQHTDGVSELEWGRKDGGGSEAVLMIVRVREIDGGFGPRVEKRVVLPRAAGLLIGAGLEVPVTRRPDTGALVDVDRGALIDELSPQFAEALAGEQARRNIDVGTVAAAARDGYREMRAAEADATPPDELHGVTADQWLQARRVLAKGIPDAVRERTLGAYGIPAALWDDVDAAWSQRAVDDPDLAERLRSL